MKGRTDIGQPAHRSAQPGSGDAAVDIQGGAVNHARLAGCEKGDGVGDVTCEVGGDKVGLPPSARFPSPPLSPGRRRAPDDHVRAACREYAGDGAADTARRPRDCCLPVEGRVTTGNGNSCGLRREEVAMRASLSTDHYSRLEQGRQAAVSESALKALTRALRLEQAEAAHLRDLATPPGRSRRPAVTMQRADPGLLRVATALDHVPVLLLGQRGEVLARNALLKAVLGHPMLPRLVVHRLSVPRAAGRERIVNWADFAASSIATMRMELGRHPDDQRLAVAVERCAIPIRMLPAGGMTTQCATMPRSASGSRIPRQAPPTSTSK